MKILNDFFTYIFAFKKIFFSWYSLIICIFNSQFVYYDIETDLRFWISSSDKEQYKPFFREEFSSLFWILMILYI